MQGAPNFRDIGGCRAADGGTVRSGCVFRSGSLVHLTADDRSRLQAFGLKRIVDLRSPHERRIEDCAAVVGTIPVLAWESAIDFRADMARLIADPGFDVGRARAFVRDLYCRFPLLLRAPLSALLQGVATGEMPVLVHCAAGKDRTGIAIAVLLRAAGVHPDDIVADYVRSGALVDLEADWRNKRAVGWNVGEVQLLAVPADVRAALLATDADYLRAAFAAIGEAWGSVDAFIRDGLAISDAARDAIRQRLVT